MYLCPKHLENPQGPLDNKTASEMHVAPRLLSIVDNMQYAISHQGLTK